MDVQQMIRTSNPARHSDEVDKGHEHAPDAANHRDANEERAEPENQTLKQNSQKCRRNLRQT